MTVIKKTIQVCYRATPAYPPLSLSANAPILLPSLHLLSSVTVADPCYWNTKFLPGENDDWPDLSLLLSRGGHMRVKRREGSGWLTKAARLTPWSLGKAQQEKLTSVGGRGDKMICVLPTPNFRPLGSIQPAAAQRLPLGVGFSTSLSFVQVSKNELFSLLKLLLYKPCP